MKQNVKTTSRGFTLIASLLLLLLLSGMSIALLMMVNTEQRSGGYDLNNTYTYHAAEGAIEKMTSDVAATFKNIQSPTGSQICALSSNYPTWDTTITYTTYNISPVSNSSTPCTLMTPLPWGPIQSGPNAGLYAQIIPVTMNVTAQRGTGEAVSMTRTAEVALIPVFQFGVFSDSDLFFGRSPNLGFAGRVHTNGDLYLGVANGANLVFGDKMSAFGNVIREQMDNGVATVGNDNQGTVMIPTQANGCAAEMANVAAATPSATCVDIATTSLGATLGSVVNGHGSAQNTASWKSVSTGTYQGYLIDGNGNLVTAQPGTNSTGATDLTLPFVSGTTNAVQIIRVPPAGEVITSVLGQNREANMAQIRILLADNESQLHLSDWNGNAAQDYQLVSMLPTALTGLPQGSAGGTQASAGLVVPATGANTYYFAESYCTGTAAMTTYLAGGYPAGRICSNAKGGDSNQVIPPYYGPMSNGPGGAALVPTAFPAEASFTTANTGAAGGNGVEWPLIGGWLLVEVKFASDEKWHGVTQEWLQLGFARGLQVPTMPGTPYNAPASNTMGVYGSNYLQDHKDAILYFQETADRSPVGGNNAVVGTGAGTDLPLTANFFGAGSQYNWYPINLYDAREGENNDAGGFAAGTGTPNGVMNSVELDVGNLKNWLLGLTGSGTGANVDYSTQNGYVLYFSDRRGMQFATSTQGANYQQYWGEYGFEDSVNYANAGAAFAPDGALDPANYNGISAEDLNGNNMLDSYGVKYVGDAFGTTTTTDTDTAAIRSPYAIGHRFFTYTIGRANRVTGARHALKLVDGNMGNLPTMPPGNAVNNCAYVNATSGAAQPTGCGGFTVAAENPVYIQGNYNSNCPAAGKNCTPTNAGFSANYDPTWTGGAEPNHAAAAIISDAVTLLSNNWQDAGCTPSGGACTAALNTTTGSLVNPTNPGGQGVPAQTPNRIAVNTYYRVAIAAGKNIAFYNTVQNPEFAYGMDGGVHNFLRFLEDWGGPAAAGAQQQLYYKGSIVSLYWSYYNTGPFKCCNTVYNPPDRQYTFDGLFSQPQNLPPGTPMFRNVDNLTYRQNQIALTSAP